MSLRSATVLDRERIRAEAQHARDGVNTKLNIDKLAYQFLEQHHREQRLANLENKQLVIAALETKHSTETAELNSKHAQEISEIDSTKFALFEEYDTRRAAWVEAVKADEKLLVDEGLKHATTVGSLVAQKLRDDSEELQQLQTFIQKLGRSAQTTTLSWVDQILGYQQVSDPRISQARERASASRQERQRAHDALLASHDANWKARELELRVPLKIQRQQERMELEDEYVNRVVDLAQQRANVQQRQIKELETLASEQAAAHATLMVASGTAEANLQDDCMSVGQWWRDLCDTAVARQQQIDQDEQQALAEIDRREAPAMETKLPVASNPEMATNEVERKSAATSGHEAVPNPDNTAGGAADVAHINAATKMACFSNIATVTSPTIDYGDSVGAILGGINTAGSSKATSALDSVTCDTTYDLPAFEPARVIQERCSSPDSVDSDFVEI